METIWAAVIGSAVTLGVGALMLAWRLGKLQRAVESHSHVLENGLTTKVEDNRVEIAGIREHQRAQDDRLVEIKDALKMITEQLRDLPRPGRDAAA